MSDAMYAIPLALLVLTGIVLAIFWIVNALLRALAMPADEPHGDDSRDWSPERRAAEFEAWRATNATANAKRPTSSPAKSGTRTRTRRRVTADSANRVETDSLDRVGGSARGPK